MIKALFFASALACSAQTVSLTGVDTLFGYPEAVLTVDGRQIIIPVGATVANITFVKLSSISKAVILVNGNVLVLSVAGYQPPVPPPKVRFTEPCPLVMSGCEVQRLYEEAGLPLPPGIDLQKEAEKLSVTLTPADLSALFDPHPDE